MNWKAACGVVVLAVLVAGCTTVDDRLQTMQNENARLARELSESQAENLQLTQENRQLEEEMNYQTKRSTVLEREKSARVAEIDTLRGGVQEFSDQVVSNLRKLYEETVPVDYLGSEICPRDSTDDNRGCLFVDAQNRFASGGTLVGGRAFVEGPFGEAPVQVQFCILRADEQGRLKVQWMSNAVTAAKRGRHDWRFDFPFQVYAQDVFAVYSAGAVSIPYDDADTGNVLVVPGDFKIGTEATLPSTANRNKRAYSIGVTGYFSGQ